MSLPCDGCAHLPVCAIAPVLRDQLAPFRAPELIAAPAGTVVEVRIDVSCEYFLRPSTRDEEAAAARRRDAWTPEKRAAAAERARDAARPDELSAEDQRRIDVQHRYLEERDRRMDAAEAAPVTVPLTVEILAATGHAPPPAAETFTCASCGREFTKRNAWTMHVRSHSQPADGRSAAAAARESASVKAVAAAIREREATAPQNEKTGETFEERRARVARERANANLAARRQA
jgi:hypothetical protein